MTRGRDGARPAVEVRERMAAILLPCGRRHHPARWVMR
jgi:hypothetical protein